MKLKKNDTVTLKIENITNLGYGVAHHHGSVIFVSDAVTEDEVEAKIIKVAPSYSVARVEKYIKRSPLRTDGRCDCKSCKSCAYKLIDYTHELEIKRQNVEADFRKCGLADIEILPVTPSPEISGYRNKAQYPVSRTADGSYTVGFYAPKSHRVTEARTCPLAPEIFSRIINALTDFLAENDISTYDEQTGKGLLRHIYLRRAEQSGEVLLTLVINGDGIPRQNDLVERLIGAFPELVGILLNINKEETNVILGDSFITLYGRDYIVDTLAGVKLRISAPSFYQVNHNAAELLYAKARELAEPTEGDTLLDLYCGAGSIGLSMADSVGELIGIEIVDAAIECAKQNAKDNGIQNARFFTGDAKHTERMLDNAQAELDRQITPSIVILDPPRAGCDKELINYVASLNPSRIVYISCNSATLARDVAHFGTLGYTSKSVAPFDLFPATGHCEAVTLLTKKTDEHSMKLNPTPFEMIKRGDKTIELRLNDEKRRKIKVGDRIIFTNNKTGEQLTKNVLRLHRFESFEELYSALPLLKCGYTEDNIATAAASDMESYYSQEEQKKYGVLGIELC